MFEERPVTQLAYVQSRLPGSHLELVIASILAGNTGGRLWVGSSPKAPLLLWDQGNNVFYVAGELDEASHQALFSLLAETVAPLSLQAGRQWFKAQLVGSHKSGGLEALFAGRKLWPLESSFYGLGPRWPAPIEPAVEGVTFVPIDAVLLHAGDRQSAGEIREEIEQMWPSLDRFGAYGLGVAAIHDGRVACWCTAEYLSADRCGIGIATTPSLEGRGLATATGARMLLACRERGLRPYWECRANNLGSIRVAEKLGFELLAEEAYVVGQW